MMPSESTAYRPFLNFRRDQILYTHIAVFKCFYVIHILQCWASLTVLAAVAAIFFFWDELVTGLPLSGFLLSYSILPFYFYFNPVPGMVFYFLAKNVVAVPACELLLDVVIAGSLPWTYKMLFEVLGRAFLFFEENYCVIVVVLMVWRKTHDFRFSDWLASEISALFRK